MVSGSGFSGYAKTQIYLGIKYNEGQGVRQDYVKAAEQGIADAQLNLGVMYEYGQGV